MALTYNEAVEQTITAGEQLHQIVNGTGSTEISVEDGSKIPSVRKALLDNFYFKDPLAWSQGQNEVVFNQLRNFTDGSWWYAPSATATNPIAMGASPIGNPLWHVYSLDAVVKLTPQIREALRRSYAEAGYDLVGDFSDTGLAVNTITDVVLWEPTGVAYAYGGTLPHTVGAGEIPIGNPLWVGKAADTLRNQLASPNGPINFSRNGLRDFISVKDKVFGVVGDGIADDFTGVSNALLSAAGKTLFFPKGTYKMGGGTPVIPSDVTVVFEPGATLVQPNKGKFAGFAIMPGSINIEVIDADIRGPWYGTGPGAWVGHNDDVTVDGDTWATHMAENIGIDVRGRWYQRIVLGMDAPTMGALTDVNNSITIKGCNINGFGQSGIIADQCTTLRISENNIRQCGRDGVRMYGASRAVVDKNIIGNLAPGKDGNYPNFNVYGVTATRVFGSSTVPDPNSTIFRTSKDVLITGNHVYNCHTWKSLDTHGGINIRFTDNHLLNSYIGIGADQAGTTTTNGINPVRGLIVSNNILESDSNAPYMRAGMALYGHDSADQAIVDSVVSGNILKGYGGSDTDGGISLSNVKRMAVTSNVITDAPKAAILLASVCEDVSVSDNLIYDPKGYVTVVTTALGSGYTTATCNVTGGGGSGLNVNPIITGGQITSYDVVHPGAGYTSAPTVTVSGDGSGATASAAFNPGYGVAVQTTTATGSINGNQFRNVTQSNIRAISLQTPTSGYGIKIGNENVFSGTMTKVYPTLDNAAIGSFGRIPVAIARVTSAGSIISSLGVDSVTKTGTGTYTVVLKTPLGNINGGIPDAAPYNSLNHARASMFDAGTVNVVTATLSSVAADASFVLTVWNAIQ